MMGATPQVRRIGGECVRALVPLALISMYTVYNGQAPTRAAEVPALGRADATCTPSAKAYLRTTLYFGTTHAGGNVSEEQWRTFLRDEVTPRFPEGLTVWEATGQWRARDGHVGQERAKVLLIVHDENSDVRAALAAIVKAYKRAFQQESVLSETARVCALF